MANHHQHLDSQEKLRPEADGSKLLCQSALSGVVEAGIDMRSRVRVMTHRALLARRSPATVQPMSHFTTHDA